MKIQALLVVLLTTIIFAQVPNFFDSLSSSQKSTLASVVTNYTPLFSQDQRLSQLAKPPASRTSKGYRLYNFVAWNIMKGATSEQALVELQKRDSLFALVVPHKDTILSAPTTALAGDSASPILISFYMTSGCPACKRAGVPLYELATGPLVGRIAIAMKPIRNTDGDKALLAANEQGRMWDLFMGYAESGAHLDRLTVMEIAERQKLDVSRLMGITNRNEKEYIEILAANRAEGRAHGLRFTPTLFFNGIRYMSNRHPLWIIDYVELLEQQW